MKRSFPSALNRRRSQHTAGPHRQCCPDDSALPLPMLRHLVLESFGNWDTCPICYWEDDLTQMRWPTMPSGANSTSLVQAQRNYRTFGACDETADSTADNPGSMSSSTPSGARSTCYVTRSSTGTRLNPGLTTTPCCAGGFPPSGAGTFLCPSFETHCQVTLLPPHQAPHQRLQIRSPGFGATGGDTFGEHSIRPVGSR